MLRKLFSIALNLRLQWRTGAVYSPRVVFPGFLSFPPGGLKLHGLFFAGPGLYLSTNLYCPIEIGDRVTIGPEMDYTGGISRTMHADNPVVGGIVIGDGA